MVVLDHLEDVLGDDAPPGLAAAVGALVSRVAEGAGARVHLVLVVDRCSFARLDQLGLPLAFRPMPGSWQTVERLDETVVAEILDRTAVHSGTFFEAGLPAAVAADLCRDRPVLAS